VVGHGALSPLLSRSEETWLVFEHHEKTRIWQLRKQSGENDNPSHDRATTVERWRELAKGRA
jgi:hypothetical protein